MGCRGHFIHRICTEGALDVDIKQVGALETLYVAKQEWDGGKKYERKKLTKKTTKLTAEPSVRGSH